MFVRRFISKEVSATQCVAMWLPPSHHHSNLSLFDKKSSLSKYFTSCDRFCATAIVYLTIHLFKSANLTQDDQLTVGINEQIVVDGSNDSLHLLRSLHSVD